MVFIFLAYFTLYNGDLLHWEDPEGSGAEGGGRGGLGWGIHVYPWLSHVNVCQKTLQYCKVISLQLIKK